MVLSKAACELAKILGEDGPEAQRLKTGKRDGHEGIHYTQLWRYRTGKSKPTVGIAAWIERATGGRVKAADWEEPRAQTNGEP